MHITQVMRSNKGSVCWRPTWISKLSTSRRQWKQTITRMLKIRTGVYRRRYQTEDWDLDTRRALTTDAASMRADDPSDESHSQIISGLAWMTWQVKLETYKSEKEGINRNIYSQSSERWSNSLRVWQLSSDIAATKVYQFRSTTGWRFLATNHHLTTFSMYLCLHRRWSSTQKQSIRKTYQKQMNSTLWRSL
jgi:hypothetical protein